jgi:tetratricopeptide (TPR) repeat protein
MVKMNLEKFKREFNALIDSFDQYEKNDSDQISTALNNVAVELEQLLSKIKSVVVKKGINDSEENRNQDAFFNSIKHLRRENAYYELLDFSEAVRELKRVIAESTDSHVIASAYNGLGHIYAARKYYPEALFNFQQVVEFYPAYIDGYYNLGAIYYNLEMYDDAIKEFNKVISLDRNDKEALLALNNAYKNRSERAIVNK